MNTLKLPILKQIHENYPELNIRHDHYGYRLLISTAQKILNLAITEEQRQEVLNAVQEHRAIEKKKHKKYHSTPKGRAKRAEGCAKRRAQQAYAHESSIQDKNKLKEKYREAAKKTEETGVQYVVDHVIPLHGEDEEGNHLVCGLHVWWNLQVITALENGIKGCKFKDTDALFSS